MNFNPVFVSATDLGDCWFQLLYNLKQYGRKYLITKGSYEGQYRLAFDEVSGFIKYPHTRPLSPIIPEGTNIPAPCTDEDAEKYFVEYLMDGNIKDNEDYKYSLWMVGGKYQIPKINLLYKNKESLTNFMNPKDFSIIVPNQIEWLIDHFKKFGFGNEHGYLSIGYPESNFAYDIPYNNEQERKTSPCLRGLDFRIIEDGGINYLTTKVIYRSWDLWGGWPMNMSGFTLLNEYVANELGVEPGPLSFTSKNLHCYAFQLDVLNQRLGKS